MLNSRANPTARHPLLMTCVTSLLQWPFFRAISPFSHLLKFTVAYESRLFLESMTGVLTLNISNIFSIIFAFQWCFRWFSCSNFRGPRFGQIWRLVHVSSLSQRRTRPAVGTTNANRSDWGVVFQVVGPQRAPLPGVAPI